MSETNVLTMPAPCVFCSVLIDMTGAGISGGSWWTPAPPPSDGINRPYRQGIDPSKMDMGAFVNDLKNFWSKDAPKTSAGGSGKVLSSMLPSLLMSMAVCCWTAVWAVSA